MIKTNVSENVAQKIRNTKKKGSGKPQFSIILMWTVKKKEKKKRKVY